MGMSQFWYIRVDLVERIWRVTQTRTYGKSPLSAKNYCIHYPMHLLVHIRNTGTKNDILTCTHSEHRNEERHPYSAYFAIATHQAVRSWVRSKLMGCTVCHSKEIPSLVQDVLDNIPPMAIPLSTTRTNVYDSKEGRVHGFLFGASPGRGPQVAKA
eukprot:2521759-Amphidinium_carterae.1